MQLKTNATMNVVLTVSLLAAVGRSALAGVTLQPGTALDDTHVSANIMWSSSYADGNYAEDWLGAFTYDASAGEMFGSPSRLGWVQESLIRFDLSSLSWEGDIEITSAVLTVNHVANPFGGFDDNYLPRETNTLGLYAVEDDWNEYDVTYNTRPGPFAPYASQTAPWVPGVANPPEYDYSEAGEMVDTWSFPDDGDANPMEPIAEPVGAIDLDVTDYITEALLGTRANHGWYLTMLLNQDQIWNEGFPVFASGDWQPGDDLSLSPKLTIIGNVVPEPTSLALLSLGALLTLRRR
ncbi:MAG: DNRLRE domain-containing protein [Phycisphaerae bacterium]|jgi:hypothetical protein